MRRPCESCQIGLQKHILYVTIDLTMTPIQLKKIVINVLEEHKAINIDVLDVRKISDVSDYLIICSATSARHIKALSDHIIEQVKKSGVKPIGYEGRKGEHGWALLDLVDVIVHIMTSEVREFYNLEKLWSTVVVAPSDKATTPNKKIVVAKKVTKASAKKIVTTKKTSKTSAPKKSSASKKTTSKSAIKKISKTKSAATKKLKPKVQSKLKAPSKSETKSKPKVQKKPQKLGMKTQKVTKTSKKPLRKPAAKKRNP